MQSNKIDQVQLLVLASGATPQESAAARGRLFEVFVANLLHIYGYERPTSSNVNVTSEGIELDVVTRHRLSTKAALAECKAYGRPVKAAELTNFYGKLTVRRFTTPDALGLMVVIPKLTAEGEEQARSIMEKDTNFQYLSAAAIITRLKDEKVVTDFALGSRITSDPAIVITTQGTYSTVLELDPSSRSPVKVLCWAAQGSVPLRTLELIKEHEYSQGLAVSDVDVAVRSLFTADYLDTPVDTHILALVQGSKDDFQYQLPASPKFFVGRRDVVSTIKAFISSDARTFVLNAQSGWGKSSLALKFGELVDAESGYSIVMDTRTASSPRYVVEVLQKAAQEADAAGVLKLPTEPNWASLPSAIQTYANCTWSSGDRHVLIFFDQFENVFRSEELTRSFRDLSLAAAELAAPLIVGFAWKTDLVGWTENHPYRLRDEIRSQATVVIVEPFGSKEVSTLIQRLERKAATTLVRDLKDRLREYSQGLPWLLKKLADHVLREMERGETQEQLLSEALNVQSLFESDLAELTPNQHEILRHVARYAPIAASEVTERYPYDAVQSLVDRRLIVQIGDRIDTYWDTFRDFLNTGRVPVEDSYILRQTPNAVARMLPAVMAAGGSASVGTLAAALETSDNVIFNLSRELRLLGVATYESLRVRISDPILQSADPEAEIRTYISRSLRRHRAFSTLKSIDERQDGEITAETYARALPGAFPAVSVTANTWTVYARVFLGWFEYAGLVVKRGGGAWSVRSDGDAPAGKRLLSSRSALRVRPSVPQEGIGPSRLILSEIAQGKTISLASAVGSRRDAIRTLAGIGAVSVDSAGIVRPTPNLLRDGGIRPGALKTLLARAPGGDAGMRLLESNAEASPSEVGEAIREQIQARWATSTVHGIGGFFRAWAKEAGVNVKPVPRKKQVKDPVPPSGEPDAYEVAIREMLTEEVRKGASSRYLQETDELVNFGDSAVDASFKRLSDGKLIVIEVKKDLFKGAVGQGSATLREFLESRLNSAEFVDAVGGMLVITDDLPRNAVQTFVDQIDKAQSSVSVVLAHVRGREGQERLIKALQQTAFQPGHSYEG